jgi:hypothetical protein
MKTATTAVMDTLLYVLSVVLSFASCDVGGRGHGRGLRANVQVAVETQISVML